MPCKEDVKAAILDKVFSEMTGGRNTFTRLAEDTLRINAVQDNSNTKAQSRSQARMIAKNLADKISNSFNGQVRGFIMDEEGQPIRLKLVVADAYVEHEFNKNEELERDYVNTNTGPNTYRQLQMFDASPSVNLGQFEKFVQFKQTQLSDYRRRLGEIEKQERDVKKTTAELTVLKNEKRKINLLIDGNQALNIKGIKDEIAELIGIADVAATAPYVEKDLQRLNLLANSDDIDDLNEAQRLVDFYDLAGSFKKNMKVNGNPVSNPFFSEVEMFLPDQNGNLTGEYLVDEATRKQFEAWRSKAIGYGNLINDKFKQKLVDTVNSDSSMVKTFGQRKFSFEELTNQEKGLKDTDWISMWSMDVTHGIFSHNGLLPQVGYSALMNEYNKGLVRVKNFNEKMDELNPKVIKRLHEINQTLASKGIVGIKGISYQIFKEITKDGNETTGLVQRFTKEYADTFARAKYEFDRKYKAAAKLSDPAQQRAAYNKAFEQFKKWKRENTIILDISKLPEVAAEPEFSGIGAIADTAYKQSLINILGQKGYDEQIANQFKLLRNFQADRQSMIENLLVLRNKATFADLDNADKNIIESWSATRSPLKGIDDYNNVTGILFGTNKTNNFMNYNSFIPRKYKANVVSNIATNKYEITDTTTPTEHYSEPFAEIEKDPILSEFYDLVKEGMQAIRDAMPPEQQEKIPQHTILTMQRTSAEVALDRNTGLLRGLFPAFKDMWDKLRQSFGVTKQSELSYANIDPVTGKPNYRINDDFFKGNTRQIKELMLIESTKFMQAYNSGKPSYDRLNEIKRHTVKDLKTFNESSLLALAGYLHVDISVAEIRTGQLDKIKSKVHAVTDHKGNTIHLVEIGKYIRDFSIHTMVQSQSFDLAKLMKYYHNLAQIYDAKQKALPVLEIVKKFYQQLQQPGTQNLGIQTLHVPTDTLSKDGLRERGNKQYENWFNRVILGNTGSKHAGVYGSKDTNSLLGERIFSTEERKKFDELTQLIDNEPAQIDDGNGGLIANPKIDELKKVQDKLGKTRTATALIDNFLEWIKVLRLGYSLSSMSTNFMEGLVSNLMLGSTDEYFDPKELYYGYSLVKHAFLKNITFGHPAFETGKAKKLRTFMDRHNVIIDSSNENQRSSHQTYSDKLSWLNPHAGNQRTEYVNQAPLMVASLRTIKIKDINGNEKSVWDASDNNGRLLPDFKTPENLENWEDLHGPQYLNYKQKLEDMITKGHGNYSELRGMMAKSQSAGKATMMFKTWVPQQLAWRLGVEQPDIQSGKQKLKGTFRSLNRGSAALYGGTVGLAMLGPLGGLGGFALGLGAAAAFKGSDAGVGVIKETIESARLLFKKMLGMPVNILAGRQIINVHKKSILGKGQYFDWQTGARFTKVDQNNLKNNMTDIAMQLNFLMAILLVKGFFWDDDDNKEDAERVAHNVMVNKLMQLSQQAGSYVNPKDIYHSTVGTMAVLQYLEDLGKEVLKIDKFLKGKDNISGGVNSGESGLWNQTKKIAMPGIFKDGNPAISLIKGQFPSLGFGSQADKQFQPSPFDDWFKSAETLDAERNKGDRSSRKAELIKEKPLTGYEGTLEEQTAARDKEIRKQLDTEKPTPKRLKKLGMSREEYDNSLQPQ